MARRYRVGEVATLTGVSIRTLHHYDRIGLLRPSAHSDAGYRLYAAEDVLRLQQILTLRYLGFPLKRIGPLLDRPDFDLVASMRIQCGALRNRIAELERIEAAVGELVDRRLATGEWSWELVASASTAVQHGLSHGGTEMEDRYTPEQMRQFAALRQTIPAGEIAAVEQGWTALLADVRANRDLDPSSPAARDLADRWQSLTDRTMRGYGSQPSLRDAIGANYERGAFEGFDRAPQAADFAFIQRVNDARRDNDTSTAGVVEPKPPCR
jgi:DNA-binding transcriptional MerR regulator